MPCRRMHDASNTMVEKQITNTPFCMISCISWPALRRKALIVSQPVDEIEMTNRRFLASSWSEGGLIALSMDYHCSLSKIHDRLTRIIIIPTHHVHALSLFIGVTCTRFRHRNYFFTHTHRVHALFLSVHCAIHTAG